MLEEPQGNAVKKKESNKRRDEKNSRLREE